jgi:hypothetical protein
VGIIINIFTFQKQFDAILALQKLEQLEDHELLSKFVLAKDPANTPYLIGNSKDGFKYKEYLNGNSVGNPYGIELYWNDALKAYGLGYDDQYLENLETGIPAGKAVLVVSTYPNWSASWFKDTARLECALIQAPLNPDITPPGKIADLIASDYRNNPTAG